MHPKGMVQMMGYPRLTWEFDPEKWPTAELSGEIKEHRQPKWIRDLKDHEPADPGCR